MDSLLNIQEAARYVSLSVSSLAKFRVYGGGPKYVRLSPRSIRYRKSDLDEWVAARMHANTTEYR